MYMLRVKFNFRLTSFFNLGWFSWTTWNIREKVYNDAKSDFAGVAVVI